ncbi:MAG: DUF4331 domain-containing protein [Alphaproteobacteria bacterium]|nr:DUF4331 domain-containing protein [Alphaproteobacteria bacterium]
MRPSKSIVLASLAALAVGAGNTTHASDHYDGPAVLGDPTTDITDMYVFPSPGNADRLVMVMNVIPNAGTTKWFSHALDYRFRLRPVTVSRTGPKAGFKVGNPDITFRCVFSDLKQINGSPGQTGHCHTPKGEIKFAVGRATSEKKFKQHGIRVFTGSRLDPFFMDVEGMIRSTKEGRENFTGINSAEGKNILSIVLEVDKRRMLPDGKGMYGVVSEVRSRGRRSVVLDTFGRPEVTNVILADPSFDKVNRTIDVRDLFNRHDPFTRAKAYAEPFRARFNANLHQIDKIDGKIDWPMHSGVHPLTELQLADFTVIDLSQPFGKGNWFEIEKAIVEGREHQTSGGRWLDDDICDIQYSFLIARDRKKISDGVDKPTRWASKKFPYLRKPTAASE